MYSATYYQLHREQVDAANRRWRLAHPEKYRAYNREYFRQWCKAHPEIRRVHQRRYYLKHREQILAAERKWYRDNLPISREYSRQRQAAYLKTFRGYLIQRWQVLQSRIRGRSEYLNAVGVRLMSKAAFILWASRNRRFRNLWKAYVRSRFDGRKAPSLVRVNRAEGYVAENLMIIAHSKIYDKSEVRKAKRCVQ